MGAGEPSHPGFARVGLINQGYLESVPPTNSEIRRYRRSGVLVQHSHTLNTRHPCFRSFRMLRLSRCTFPLRFVCQNSAFVAGINLPYLQRCMCQKQPWTKIIDLCFGSTMSGRPGKSRTCNLYLNPSECSRRLTIISGRVSLPRICDMLKLRCRWVRTSAISRQPLAYSANESVHVENPDWRAGRVLPVKSGGHNELHVRAVHLAWPAPGPVATSVPQSPLLDSARAGKIAALKWPRPIGTAKN